MTKENTTASSATPLPSRWSWFLCDPRGVLIMLVPVSLLLAVLILKIAGTPEGDTSLSVVSTLTVGFYLVLAFLYLFTGGIDRIKMTGMVVFSYVFTFGALVFSVLPFLSDGKGWSVWESGLRQSPIGVVRGCVYDPDDKLPAELRCSAEVQEGTGGKHNYRQWVINIGGDVVDMPVPSAESGTVDQGAESGKPAGNASSEKTTGTVAAPLPQPVVGEDGVAPEENKRVFVDQDEPEDAAHGREPGAEPTQPEQPRSVDSDIQKAGKTETDKHDLSKAPAQAGVIYGGLVVPLYVVVLALMGGAVSMTRRVPEYQRQVWAYFWHQQEICEPVKAADKNAGDGQEQETTAEAVTEKVKEQILAETKGRGTVQAISGPAAREYLVFQLMQVVSAPLIAVTAYYVIAPATVSGSAALGFFSGFASEVVLLGMRAVAEQVAKLPPSERVTSQGGQSGQGGQNG